MGFEDHEHNGMDSKKVRPKNIAGTPAEIETFIKRSNSFFPTVTVFPIDTPSSWLDQIRIWDDTAGSGEFFLVVYDTTSETWQTFDNTP